MKRKISIDIISDIICPWCYIGKSRLMQAIEQVSKDFEVTTRLRPFQLYPNIPVGGRPKTAFPSAKKPGLGKALKAAAAAENIVFNYQDIQMIPNTLEAHRIMTLCRDNDTKNRLGMDLFVNYFEKAEDMEDPLVLARIARDAYVPKLVIDHFLQTDKGRMELIEEIKVLKKDGISAVPSFILEGGIIVMGVQPVNKWLRYFDRMKAKMV